MPWVDRTPRKPRKPRKSRWDGRQGARRFSYFSSVGVREHVFAFFECETRDEDCGATKSRHGRQVR